MKLSESIIRYPLNKENILLINPITGAIDIAPNKILTQMSEEDKNYLTSRGYFLSGKERLSALKNLQKTYEQHSENVPYRFYILTTLNCNFGCPICYEKKTLENSEATLEKLEKIIQAIHTFQQEHKIEDKKMNLIIFGGEPLCVSDKEIIHYILDSAAQRNWEVIIVTNGSRVKDFIDLFVKYSKTISGFRVTLDGPPEIHDARRPYRWWQSSFPDVVKAIDLLLENHLPVKMQTILWAGNREHLEELILFVQGKGWLKNKFFEWRIEWSHDYANLDPTKDEISEGKIVQTLIQLWEKYWELNGKLKFESFKYLGHIVRSFWWLWTYKTYRWPKYGFCDPQKWFHYVCWTDGTIYHCPRTINTPEFRVGDIQEGIDANHVLKNKKILDDKKCVDCTINTLCGGGCVVQQKYYPDLDCKIYATNIIEEFIDIMKEKIVEKADPEKIVPINDLWQ